MVRENPVQVVIPFDASAEMREVKSHITDTITRVICKVSNLLRGKYIGTFNWNCIYRKKEGKIY